MRARATPRCPPPARWPAGRRRRRRPGRLGVARESTSSLFYVATLEYLRRGGRVGAAAALVGSALAVKPILAIEDGRVVTREKVRTASRAIARLEDLAARAAGVRPVEVTVTHLDNPDQAEALSERLAGRLGERLVGPIRVGEVGAVLGAHVGPGLLGVVVAPVLPDDGD